MCEHELPIYVTVYRLTDRHDRNYIPRRFAGGQQNSEGVMATENDDIQMMMNWQMCSGITVKDHVCAMPMMPSLSLMNCR